MFYGCLCKHTCFIQSYLQYTHLSIQILLRIGSTSSIICQWNIMDAKQLFYGLENCVEISCRRGRYIYKVAPTIRYHK